MKQERPISEKSQLAIAYTRKHTLVYLIPILFLIAGFYFLLQEELVTKVAGLFLCLGAIVRIAQVSMVRWYLTSEHVIVRHGWPWAKRVQEIPVFELYQSTASRGRFSGLFNTATLTARTREGAEVSHNNISNAYEFSQQVSAAVRGSSAQPLNHALALKNQGMLTDKEYEMIKLGVFTQKYLGELAEKK